MTTQPTPEQIAGNAMWGFRDRAVAASHRPEHVEKLFLDANAAFGMADVALSGLREAGYVVVHPDDVERFGPPAVHGEELKPGVDIGWELCWMHIFGEGL